MSHCPVSVRSLPALFVALPGSQFKTATAVNLRGEKTGEPISIRADKLNINLSAYAPASFILE